MAKPIGNLLYTSFVFIGLIWPLTNSVALPVAQSSEDIIITCGGCSDKQDDGSCKDRLICDSDKAMNPKNGCRCECKAQFPLPYITDPTTCAQICPPRALPCPEGQIEDPATCQCDCPSSKSKCCACPEGQYYDGTKCKCPGAQYLDGTTCKSCLAGQYFNGTACTSCSGGQYFDGATCKCPDGQYFDGTTCECPGGQSLVGTVCKCPTGQSFDGIVCRNDPPTPTPMPATPTSTPATPTPIPTCPPTSPCSANQIREAFPGCKCVCDTAACPVTGQTRKSFPNCACGPCPTTKPFTVNGACSACNAADRTKKTGSPEPDGCCPDTQPFVINNKCNANSCVLSFKVQSSGGENFVDRYTNTVKSPSCLDQRVANCRTAARIGTEDDNGIANCIISALRSGTNQVSKTNCDVIGSGSNCVVDSYYRNVESYFDSNCNGVPADLAGVSKCSAGQYSFSISPVALLWNKSFGIEDLSKNVRLVSFPLDPNKPDQFVEWKASSEAPLLVYDPEGTGKVVTGYQLFGNWTFGPKKIASLTSTHVTNTKKLWDNGFDALATLDTDADGEVSGAELDPLSLWFDDNRNAISENGEVRRLSTVGVNKLFYRNYQLDVPAHAITLTVGFERDRNGKTEQGTMVDWFADSVSSELEYAQKAMLTSPFRKIDNDSTVKSSLASAHEDLLPTDKSELLAHKNGAAAVRGVWKWVSKSDKIATKGGTFVISANQDGTISGMTMMELAIDSSFGATSVATSIGLLGTAKLADDGSVSLNFELNKESGTDLKSTAKLAAGSEKIMGTSKGIIKGTAANTEISYDWVATRMK